MKVLDTYHNEAGQPLVELVEETLPDGSTVQDVIIYKCRMYPHDAQTAYCTLVELLDDNNAERY